MVCWLAISVTLLKLRSADIARLPHGKEYRRQTNAWLGGLGLDDEFSAWQGVRAFIASSSRKAKSRGGEKEQSGWKGSRGDRGEKGSRGVQRGQESWGGHGGIKRAEDGCSLFPRIRSLILPIAIRTHTRTRTCTSLYFSHTPPTHHLHIALLH